MSAGWFCWFGVIAEAAADEDARYDFYRWQATVTGGRVVLQVHFQITIPSAARSEFGNVSLVESKYSRIRQVEFRLMGPNGKPIQKLKKDDLTKACGFGAGFELYSDICHYFGTLAPPGYPAVIAGEYTIDYENLFFLPSPDIQRTDASIALAEVSLTFDAGSPVAWKSYGLAVQPTVTTTGKQTTVAWILEDLPPDPEMLRLPPEEIGIPRISFAAELFELEGYKVEGRTWQNLGTWYNKIAATQYLPEGMEVSTGQASLQDARRIFLDLTHSTRYVAVSVGLSGWQPHSAGSVAAKGYGDCKDLSTLLISRLRAAGIAAWPVLVRTRDLGILDPDFAENYFNHLITCAVVGSDTLWMDPTCSECLPGDLPSMDENTLALLVDLEGGKIVRLPESQAADNALCRVAQVTIDDTAFTKLQVTATVTGNLSHSVRKFLKHAQSDQLADFTHDYLLAGDRRYRIIGQSHSGVDSVELPVSLSGELVGTRKLDRIKEVVYLNPFVMVERNKWGDLRLSGRTSAVDLVYPWSAVDSVVIGGPFFATCDSISLPSNDSSAFPGGKVVVTYRYTQGGVCAVAKQEYNESTVPPDHFAALEAFLSSYRKLLDRPIKMHLRSTTK